MATVYIVRDGYYSERITGIFLDKSLAELHADAGGWDVEEFEILTDVLPEIRNGLKFYQVDTWRRPDIVGRARRANFMEDRAPIGIFGHENPYHQTMVIRVWAHNENEALEMAERIRQPYIVQAP